MTIIKLLPIFFLLLIIPVSVYGSHDGAIQVPNNVPLGDGFRFYIVNSAGDGIASGSMFVNGTIDYVHGIQNTGTEPITNIEVHTFLDDKETDFRQGVVQGASNIRTVGDCSIDGIDIICKIPDLLPGERFPAVGGYHYLTTATEVGHIFNEANLCGDAANGTRFCASDRSSVTIISSDIPTPPRISVEVDGLQFTVSWEVDRDPDFRLPFGVRYIVLNSTDGSIIEDWQPLEKECPIAQGQCGALDFDNTNSNTQGGGYIHTHQFTPVEPLTHCFEVTAKFNLHDDQVVQVCADTESVFIPEPEPIPDPIICDEGFELINDVCEEIIIIPEPIPDPIICDDGFELVGGICEEIIVIPDPIVIDIDEDLPINDTPIDPIVTEPIPDPVICGTGTELVDGVCVTIVVDDPPVSNIIQIILDMLNEINVLLLQVESFEQEVEDGLVDLQNMTNERDVLQTQLDVADVRVSNLETQLAEAQESVDILDAIRQLLS